MRRGSDRDRFSTTEWPSRIDVDLYLPGTFQFSDDVAQGLLKRAKALESRETR